MILAEEIAKIGFIPITKLDNDIIKKLHSRTCTKCDTKLEENDKIEYLLTSKGKVVWWHDGNCNYKIKKKV